MNSAKPPLTIGIVAASYPAARKLFDTFAIDYALYGAMTISEAAELEGLDPNGLVEAVAEIVRRSTPLWLEESLHDLVTVIEDHHHALSRELLFRTRLRLNEAYEGSSIEEAHALRIGFTQFAGELLAHIEYEELVVFPILRDLDGADTNATESLTVDLPRLKAAVQKLLLDHFRLSGAAQRLTALCGTIEAAHPGARSNPDALRSVFAVEKHLRHYMAIENNVLLPRALALGEQLSASRCVGQEINTPREKTVSQSPHSLSPTAQLR
jgi:regulator of cell morphogenesis and NO signaling